jgi:hypothetical protein
MVAHHTEYRLAEEVGNRRPIGEYVYALGQDSLRPDSVTMALRRGFASPGHLFRRDQEHEQESALVIANAQPASAEPVRLRDRTVRDLAARDPRTSSIRLIRTGTMTDSTATRVTRPFRFGVLAPLRTDLPTWRDQVRRIADSGYSTLLMPDFPQLQPAPAPTLAIAASLTGLRVGTWVYASPLRPAWSTAWEAHSLSVLTEGGFEMGIGTGRPGIEDELRARGMPVVPRGERLAQMREVVTTLRELDGPDLYTLMPGEDRAEMTRVVRDFRARAGRDVELAQQVAVIGDTVAPHLAIPNLDPAALRAADALETLPEDPAAVEEIQRRREEIGFSYLVFGARHAEVLAPVVAQLTGR